MNKFVHQITVIYLALIVFIRMLAMPISLLDYSFNKSFISDHLCENRLNRTMACAGKCYLHKQLTKSSENPDSRDAKGTNKITIVDFCESLNETLFSHPEKMAVHTAHFFLQHFNEPFTGQIFRPPIASYTT